MTGSLVIAPVNRSGQRQFAVAAIDMLKEAGAYQISGPVDCWPPRGV